jgi:hypothetical protein
MLVADDHYYAVRATAAESLPCRRASLLSVPPWRFFLIAALAD